MKASKRSRRFDLERMGAGKPLTPEARLKMAIKCVEDALWNLGVAQNLALTELPDDVLDLLREVKSRLMGLLAKKLMEVEVER